MDNNRENHNTMKNTAQEGARGRAGRDSPPPQQPLYILYLQKFFVKGKIAVKWRARAVRHAAGRRHAGGVPAQPAMRMGLAPRRTDSRKIKEGWGKCVSPSTKR